MALAAFLGGIGPWELLIVLTIVLILFGAGRLPQVLESFGQGIRAFRRAQREEPPLDGPRDVTLADTVDVQSGAN